MSHLSFDVVIPARWDSTRLPGKPLAQIGGQPMIQHVWENAICSGANHVIVATDYVGIYDAVREFGGRCIMTGPCKNGTQRCAEAYRYSGRAAPIIVNVQGDEPMMPPHLIAQVARNLARQTRFDIATLCTPITFWAELVDVNTVKLVKDATGGVMYCSRSVIPFDRDGARGQIEPLSGYKRKLGIYAFRGNSTLDRVARLPESDASRLESLEQLAWLHRGERLHAGLVTEDVGIGVDTYDDLAEIRKRFVGAEK